jgi:hypothetical protein
MRMNTIYSPEDIEVVFRTPDGTIHDSILEALSHLNLTPTVPASDYEMYNQDPTKGLIKTDDLESCHFVFLPDLGAKEKFFADMEEAEYTTDGVAPDEEEPAWYEWCSELWEWVHISGSMAKVLDYLKES